MKGAAEIYKSEFYALGGFANPKLFRKMRSGKWVYYKLID